MSRTAVRAAQHAKVELPSMTALVAALQKQQTDRSGSVRHRGGGVKQWRESVRLCMRLHEGEESAGLPIANTRVSGADPDPGPRSSGHTSYSEDSSQNSAAIPHSSQLISGMTSFKRSTKFEACTKYVLFQYGQKQKFHRQQVSAVPKSKINTTTESPHSSSPR